MIQNSILQWCKKSSNPFIFEKVPTPTDDKKSLYIESGSFLLVNTKPSANEHLSFQTDFSFERCLLPTQFEHFADKIRNFKVRKDDIWIFSYPNSGATWIQNIVWQLKHGVDRSKEPISSSNALYLEREIFVDGKNDEMPSKLEKLDNEPSPRIIKSHLPPNLLPIELWTIQPKIIYIARNPKDVAISMSNYYGKHFSGKIEEFFNLFIEDSLWYAPFFAHVTNYWQLRNEDNFLFLTYEDLLAMHSNGVKLISEFLECSFTDDELKLLTEFVGFGNWHQLNTKEHSDKSKVDSMCRFVKVDEMSKEYIKKFDEWTVAKLKDSDFKFNI